MNATTRIGVDPTSRDYEFWDNYPGIVWSNPEAPDSVMISNALLQGRKKVLAAVATRFGGHRLRREWEHLKTQAPAFPEIQKVIAPKLTEIDGLVKTLAQTGHA